MSRRTLPRVAGYLALLTGYSVLYTWVHGKARGSVLLAFLFHVAFNLPTLQLITEDMPAAAALRIELLSAVPLWVVVLIVLAVEGRSGLGRPRAR